MKTYLTLLRVSNLPTVWSNVIAATLLCGASFSWGELLALLLSMSLFYSGGMAFNDLCDVANDRNNRPSRPIPAGKITVSAAETVTLLLFIAALALLLSLPHRLLAIAAGLLLALLIVIYDMYHKGNPLSVLLMAGCRFMVYITAAYGVAGKIDGPVIIIALLQFGYIVLVSLTARFENRLPSGFGFPVIPLMLSAICLVDGIFMAFAISPLWLAGGICGMLLTLAGQKYVRGD
jgi:4-hydroxybenzoate polyprenyltransferase